MSRPQGAPFPPGQSGNPGGRPKSADISALARRYTADALRGLVSVARLDPNRHALAVRAASDSLIDLGYPGARKTAGEGGGVADLVQLHLLATQALGAPVQLAPPVREVVPEVPEAQAADNMLPLPHTALPHEALPLWDAAAAEIDGDRSQGVAIMHAPSPTNENIGGDDDA